MSARLNNLLDRFGIHRHQGQYTTPLHGGGCYTTCRCGTVLTVHSPVP